MLQHIHVPRGDEVRVVSCDMCFIKSPASFKRKCCQLLRLTSCGELIRCAREQVLSQGLGVEKFWLLEVLLHLLEYSPSREGFVSENLQTYLMQEIHLSEQRVEDLLNGQGEQVVEVWI